MIDSLLDKLTKEFGQFNKYGFKNILALCLGVLKKETCSLNKIKTCMPEILGKTKTKPDSHYKMLNRIFQKHSFSRLWLDLLILASFLAHRQSQYLVLDGTCWKRGKRVYHFMTLGFIYDGVAQPIYFENLNKKGISSQKERISMFKKASKSFKLSGKTLLADREYIGEEWFEYLTDSQVSFIIRCKKNTYKDAVNQSNGLSYEQMENKLLRSKKNKKNLSKKIQLGNQTVQLIMMKNPKENAEEKIIYLITNLMSNAEKVASKYIIRWQIECCFKHLKSNGFDLEKMNVKGSARSKLLMAVVVFAYALSIHQGLKKYTTVSSKKYANGSCYKAVSIFREGYAQMMTFCWNLESFAEHLLDTFYIKIPQYRSLNAILV